MAIAHPTAQQPVERIAGSTPMRSIQIALGIAAFYMLTLAGAGAIIAGSYGTWATFYAGLIERNGVSGDGKYFIAAAALAALAALLSSSRTLAPVRWLVPLAGAAVALVALRDLRNLSAIIDSPAAAFYVPARGDGLLIVIGGAALLIAAFFVAPVSPVPARGALLSALLAVALCAGIGMTVAGAYGEYFLHFASGGHTEHHTAPFRSAHVLTGAGATLLVAVLSASVYRLGMARARFAH